MGTNVLRTDLVIVTPFYFVNNVLIKSDVYILRPKSEDKVSFLFRTMKITRLCI